ncbi:MAG: helix-turn-helix transcriptional regulator [Alphaproteobacteria bacterium]|nr:helix-turn-helix transcriptional regulator [Alphaproteobacteria bacterium]
MPQKPPTFGRKLRSLRKRARFNQAQVAKALGMDRTSYGRVELGKRNMAASELDAFLRFVGISDPLERSKILSLANSEDQEPPSPVDVERCLEAA